MALEDGLGKDVKTASLTSALMAMRRMQSAASLGAAEDSIVDIVGVAPSSSTEPEGSLQRGRPKEARSS